MSKHEAHELARLREENAALRAKIARIECASQPVLAKLRLGDLQADECRYFWDTGLRLGEVRALDRALAAN